MNFYEFSYINKHKENNNWIVTQLLFLFFWDKAENNIIKTGDDNSIHPFSPKKSDNNWIEKTINN